MPKTTPPEPQPLILPRGVRLPRPDELKSVPEAEQIRIRQAQINTGYRLIPSTGGAFSAFIEANVHAINLYALFHDLALTLMPRTVAPIITVKDGEAYTGPYTMRAAVFRIFEPHVQVLQHDGFLGFGLIAQKDGVTEQLFVPPAKHLQIWTTQPEQARGVLLRHQIPETPNLQLIDQYPVVSESIETPTGEPGWPLVLQQVRSGFTTLPAPER